MMLSTIIFRASPKNAHKLLIRTTASVRYDSTTTATTTATTTTTLPPVPQIKLKNDIEMPQLGLGTWKTPPRATEKAVNEALKNGYRHFDCAARYENQELAGRAIAASGIKRKDLFITSKLWNTEHRPERVRNACEKTLLELRVKYLDLYFIHWPLCFPPDLGPYPTDPNTKKILYEDIPMKDTWQAMEELVDAGLVRGLGVCNFNAQDIEGLWDCKHKPLVNQVEIHPYMSQVDLVKWCQDKGVAMVAYAPLANVTQPGAPKMLNDPVIVGIAQKHKKTPAQIALRWLIQRGITAIPKSVNPNRIKDNISIWDFELTEDDMKKLYSLNRNHRVLNPFWLLQVRPF